MKDAPWAPRRPSSHHALWLLMLLGCATLSVRAAPAPGVIDSDSIVRSLSAPGVTTRGFVVEGRPASPAAAADAAPHISLDIRFASDSDRLTSDAQAQLAQLGSALSSPQLAHLRFLIAGHTSATGAAQHNQRLSEQRARAVRSWLLEHYHLGAARLEALGYGSSRPLPQFPPGALQQRRVEVSALPATD